MHAREIKQARQPAKSAARLVRFFFCSRILLIFN
jgi:hypothetical protein